MSNSQEVLEFWFVELEPRQWWQKDENLDQEIKQRFGEVHLDAIAGKLYNWRESGLGRLAEIIVIDQFSRNIYRDQPNAFAWDGMALILAQEAVRIGADQEFELKHKFIIDRFGRYPHRNEILGRCSTAEEIEFLSQPNSSF